MRAHRLRRQLRDPSLESLFVAAVALFGFRLGVRPIEDNSMLTHLRTGIDMVDGHGIPRKDPYSFTAAGHPWVVQSWLPEWTYGWAHRLGGFELVVIEQALLTVVLAWLIVRLARAGTALRTGLAGVIAVGVGAAYWLPRPLLFGLICMALTVTVVERRRSPWALIPIVWVWVSSHGSFPLGLVWLGARCVGEAAEWRAFPRQSARYVGGFLAGAVAAVANPLGAKLLVFPLTVADKRDIFSGIVEWQSPNFQQPGGQFALVFIVVGLALLFHHRVGWRDVVPVVTFLGLGLVAVRNLPMAAVVLAPPLGRAMRAGHGRERLGAAEGYDRRRARVNRAVLATIAALFVVFGASVFTTPPLHLTTYPVSATRWLEGQSLLGTGHRLAQQDFVGNFLILRRGRRAHVFIDDRYDMYPARLTRDYIELVHGSPKALAVLDRFGIDLVLWERRSSLAAILSSDSRWRPAYRKGDWVIYQRQPGPDATGGAGGGPAPPGR